MVSELELLKALKALQSVKTSLKELSPSDDHASGSDFEETLDKLVGMMQSKVDGPQVRHIGHHLVPQSTLKIHHFFCRLFLSLA